jgi:dienelactone hydrolase
VDGTALTVLISVDATGDYRGTLRNEAGISEELKEISWDASGCVWQLCRHSQDSWQWVRGTIRAGVFVGRCTLPSSVAIRPALAAYRRHVTGWNSTVLDQESTVRVYDVVLDSRARAWLRLDRDAAGRAQGRLKVVATRVTPDAAWDASGEEAEFDLEITRWDHALLEFSQHAPDGLRRYTGHPRGQTIEGTYTSTTHNEPRPWRGSRSEVLSYGLLARPPAERLRWQTRTRQRLQHLMMADNPTPLTMSWRFTGDAIKPLAGVPEAPLSRDDDPEGWLQNYTRRELLITCTLADPYGSETIQRELHAWLTRPTTPPARPEGYRAVLALNGHGSTERGSGAWAMLDATNGYYWYGDAFARRGFVVLALDIAHRPLEDRARMYQDRRQGDDPLHGNGPRPALASALFPHDSDWEEDGERVWDVMRALDFLLSGQAGVPIDARHVLVTGLSMGGEIATLAGALDPRIALVIPAAFSPDLGVLDARANHPCWRWQHANLLEYTDVSDWHALIAPRPLIVQSGKTDATYSSFQPPFASDKQVLRRSKAAYAEDAERLIHYLHSAQAGEAPHQYRAGDRLSTQPASPAAGISRPVVREPESDAPWSLSWQTDEHTSVQPLKGVTRPTLFDYIDDFWIE